MSSLAASSSVPPLPYTGLAHSLNSRGELGAFVNPYACSCRTCVDYVAEHAPETPALRATDCVVFPPPPPLAHTYNSSGRLGMFVNPYNCSCQTCVDHVAAEDGVTLAPPPPAIRSVGQGWGSGTGAAGGLATPSFWTALARSSSVAEEDEGAAPAAALGPSESGPWTGLAPTITGLGYEPPSFGRVTLMRSSSVPEAEEEESDDEAPPAASSVPAPPPVSSLSAAFLAAAAAGAAASEDAPTLDEETANRLRSLRAALQSRQDRVYDEETRSHDEMAAQDAEWEELDNQIHAIEQLLSSFRMVYRHR